MTPSNAVEALFELRLWLLVPLHLQLLGLALLAGAAVIIWDDVFATTKGSVPWFRPTRRITTVYLFQSIDRANLIKVGFTARPDQARQGELQRALGGKLHLVQTIRMPHAYYVEQRAHRRLAAKGWRLSRREGLGTEWYLLPPSVTPKDVAALLETWAFEVQAQAKQRRSWAGGDAIRIYQPRHTPM